MPSLELTAQGVQNIKPQDRQVDYFDTKNVIEGVGGKLVLRVSPQGRKSWCLVYRLNGQQRRYTFKKPYPSLSLKDARKEAAKKLVAILDGNDPALEVRRRRQAFTFKELAEDYLKHHAQPKKSAKSCYEDSRMISTDLAPWHHRKAEDIKRRDVIRLLDEVAERAPVSANRLKALISKIYNVGIRRDEVEFNPASNIDMPSAEKPRSRVYSDDEIRALWQAFKQARTGLLGAFELVLLTAQRPGEVTGMQWAELDGPNWSMPSERTKNRLEHIVPLSTQAMDIINGLIGNETYVFPANKNETCTRINSADLRDIRKKSKVIDFRAHDLRRTALTNMGKLGISRFIQDRIANHADSTMAGVYDKYDYLDEKAAALGRWADRLDKILTGKKAKVVKLRRAAQ